MAVKLDPEIVRQTLAGYAVVNEIAEAERRARLQIMTDEDARVIFDDLCETWERMNKKVVDTPRFNAWRIEHKIALRRALLQLYQHLNQN